MMELWSKNSEASTRELTAADLRAAHDAMRDSKPRVCGTEEWPHMVHPLALEVGGWWVCGQCFTPVEVEARR
ncbi:MAG: hypothetical protein R3324_06365 [Halobacteriales archaeon]|nr:hypothetical protein [Halobacteriales archaeon]